MKTAAGTIRLRAKDVKNRAHKALFAQITKPTKNGQWRARRVGVIVNMKPVPGIQPRASRVIAMAPPYKNHRIMGARLVAEVVAVHTYDCPFTKYGKRHGECDCGALELFELWKKGEL